MSGLNVLVLSHFNKENRVFEDYCHAIKAHSGNYTYVDYIHQYLVDGKNRFEKKLEELVNDKKIDCIFFIWWSSDLTFDPQFIRKLALLTTVVMSFFDTEYYFEGVDRYYAQLADLVLLPDWLSRYKYEQLDIPALTTFSLYDKNFYARSDGANKHIQVSFVGNLRQSNRKEYVDSLKKNGISVQTCGVGSDSGFVLFEEMADTFNRSKINLNFTASSDSRHCVIAPPAINRRIKQSKGRPIEIALCGGFVLSEYAPGLEEMFLLGQEIEVFRTQEELLEKVRYYLSHADKRAEMAQRGHERAIRDYDAVAGFAKVFQRIKEPGRTPNRTLYLDREFAENFTAYRFFYLFLFLLSGRLRNIFFELRLIFQYRRFSVRKSFHFAVKGFLYFLRGHPGLAARLKSLNRRLNIQLKY